LLERFFGWALAVLYFIMFFISRSANKHRQKYAKSAQAQQFSPEIGTNNYVVNTGGSLCCKGEKDDAGSSVYETSTPLSNYAGTTEASEKINNYNESHASGQNHGFLNVSYPPPSASPSSSSYSSPTPPSTSNNM
ncbi:3382_t:CDS:1, partial [Acaulospora colombiana]